MAEIDCQEFHGRHSFSARQWRLTSGSSQSLGRLANPEGLPLAYRALTGEAEAVELKCVVVLRLRRAPEKEDFCSVRSTQAPLFLRGFPHAVRHQFCKADVRYSSGLSIHSCNEAHCHAEARPPRWTGAGKRSSAMRR